MSLNLSKPWKEIRAAKRELEAMRSARSLADIEDSWRGALSALERCWNAVLHAGSGAGSGFQPWIGQYVAFRKTDPLVSYLHHARNSEEHSIRESIEHTPVSISVGVPPGARPTILDAKEAAFHGLPPGTAVYALPNVYIEGGTVRIEGDPRGVQIRPAHVELVPVTDSGVTFTPPNEHLGFRLASRDPAAVLQLGIRFYEDLLEAARDKF